MATSVEQQSNTKTPLKHRDVVSSFIVKYPEDGEVGGKPMVALFRRSGKVSTYQHHLAAISGSVDKNDASPLAAAWREIQEETTLTPASLEFMRYGKSFSFQDIAIGREWTVHPFAFRLKSTREGGKGEAGLQPDWEHEGWGWYDPLEVEDTEAFGGVPRLAQGLRGVWYEKDLGPAVGAVLSAGLEQLKNDQQSGARQLAGVALGVLRDVIKALDSHDPSDQWWRKVRFAAWHIWKNGRESMGAAILSVLLAALKSIEDTLHQHKEHPDSTHSAKWRDAVVADVERRISLREISPAGQVASAFIQYLHDYFSSRLESSAPVITILTLSESSTIFNSLRQAVLKSDFCLDIRVLESRPLFEGVSLAGALVHDVLSQEPPDNESPPPPAVQVDRSVPPTDWTTPPPPPPPKVSVTVVTDASAALAAEGVDVVLLGADRIASSGAVSNKTGSLPAVLSAKHVSPGAKTVVLSDSEKIAPPGDPKEHVVEDNDPNQLARAWSSDYNSDRVRTAAGGLAKTLSSLSNGAAETGPGTSGSRGARVHIRNIFFEWVPPELVDVYVTEFGIWSRNAIREHSQRMGAEQERLFKDL